MSTSVPPLDSADQNDDPDPVLKILKTEFEKIRKVLKSDSEEAQKKFEKKFEKKLGKLLKSEFDEVRKDISKLDRRIRDQEDKFRDFELSSRVSNGYIPAQPLKGYPGSALIERPEDRVELGLFY